VRDRFREYRRTRDRQLRNELIEEHRFIAEILARRFARRGEPLDDLVQVAMLALLKAVERFDPDRRVEFGTFATPTITGELKRHFRDRTWRLQVPRRAKDLHVQLRGAASAAAQRLGRQPTVTELAGEVGASEDEVLEALEIGASYRTVSLDRRLPDGPTERSAFDGDLLADERGYDEIDGRSLVADLLDGLPAREREIVELRCFAEMTQAQIAAHVGLSQMHVSRLLRRSFDDMRREVVRDLS